MKKEGNRYIYSPSDLIRFMDSEFASWMERLYLDNPNQVTPDADDELKQLLQSKGNLHEKNFLATLQNQGKDVCEITNVEDPYDSSIEAMRSGREVIYQAALRLDDFAGYADFLILEEGKSLLGDYHYQVWDTKLALSPKPYFLIQLCCYAEMLSAIQGKRPSTVGVILGDGTAKAFRTEDFFYFYLQLKEAFLEQQRLFDAQNPPELTGMEDYGRWESHAKKLLEDHDHLSRVANIRRVQIRKLHQAGIKTMRELADSKVAHVTDMAPSTLATLKQQARLQVRSANQKQPCYESIPPDPADPRRGLALLPPSSHSDICFDMEGYPHVEGGLEYLFGVIYKDRDTLAYKDWWGHNPLEEKLAFEGFIDWAHTRWKNDPTLHIYHYGDYEVSALRRLMGRHGTRERELDQLLRAEVFVNLFSIVRQSLRIGEPGYSLKNVERLYKEARTGDVATAVDSIVQYQKWLTEQAGADWLGSKILSDIRSYNREDCESTWQLSIWLRNLQREGQNSFLPKPPKPEGESQAAIARDEVGAFSQELLAELPEDSAQFTEQQKLQELLAHLLVFHWREAKPVFWAKYDRVAMTADEIIDDVNCLGGLARTNKPKEPRKRSFAYEYQFDPNQDTKLSEGDKCFAQDLSFKCEIASLNTESGLVSIKLGPSQPQPPPSQLNLIPDEYVSGDKIARSIFETVTDWRSTGKLPRAIEDFLSRRRPRIKNNTEGLILPEGLDLVAGAIDVISNLDATTLCIQGPPGSGKTYTAAQAILELLRHGKRIGVSSNSHKAIAKLINTVATEAKIRGIRFKGAKVQSDKDEFLVDDTSVKPFEKIQEAIASGYQLIGGTAWAFSDENAAGHFDYLFVDEAGQVSIANLVGMARSTTDIVLIGDQMQLNQPIKGTHPMDSGQSTLEYLLQQHQTIPDDFGIFLGLSRRMHPDVCEFISGAVYEDRLKSSPDTEKRILLRPEVVSGKSKITKPTGIIYIPVQHEGNSQGSSEEVEVVAALVQELLACQVKGLDNQARPIQLKDILIVAPFNMQVRKLQQRLKGAQIGSIDKFQGQEAPVVIVSMCSSSGDVSPRGIEFLFNKNRLNVAISRAQTLAIVVGSPTLARTKCSKVEQMELVNLFCRVVGHRMMPEALQETLLVGA